MEYLELLWAKPGGTRAWCVVGWGDRRFLVTIRQEIERWELCRHTYCRGLLYGRGQLLQQQHVPTIPGFAPGMLVHILCCANPAAQGQWLTHFPSLRDVFYHCDWNNTALATFLLQARDHWGTVPGHTLGQLAEGIHA